MTLDPNKRSNLLQMTVSELEESIRDAKTEIRDHLNIINRLNAEIIKQQEIINQTILPGYVNQTNLYKRTWGTSNVGRGYKEKQILKNYQNDIKQKRNLIGFSENMIRNAEIRIKNSEYDLRQLHHKPTKPALARGLLSRRKHSARSRRGSNGRSKSRIKGNGKKKTRRRKKL